jgi:hypothetical protein
MSYFPFRVQILQTSADISQDAAALLTLFKLNFGLKMNRKSDNNFLRN